MDPTSRPLYSIGAVSRLLAIPAATLRAWEDRYGVIRPERSPGGQRLYSREDVDNLRFVKARTEEGMAASDAFRLLEERVATRQAQEPPATTPGILILLAERDPFAAEFAEYFLRTEGYALDLVSTAEDAERRVAEASPQLAIVDMLISGGSGIDLCRTIKQLGDIPILAVSGLDARNEAFAAGADAFLAKPLDPLHLVSTVRDLLGTSAYLQTRAPVHA